MTRVVLVSLFLLACGEVPKPVDYSPQFHIPLQKSDSQTALAVDRGWQLVEEKLGTPKMLDIVLQGTKKELIEWCDAGAWTLGCYRDGEIFIRETADFARCNDFVHELGHLYFEQTEGDMDAHHQRHGDFFTWAETACLPLYKETPEY